MRITGLKIKNFIAISEQEIAPDSRLNLFIGKNGNGKTTILKAIQAGLRGTTDISVIKDGADKAEILMDIDDIQIHRTLKTKGNNTLKVTAPMKLPGGDEKRMPIPSPQEYLSGLLSEFSFDPFLFISLESKERTKYMRELFKTTLTAEQLRAAGISDNVISGINFDRDGMEILQDLYKLFYAKRSEVNKDVSRYKVLADQATEKTKDFSFDVFDGDHSAEINELIKETEKRLTEAETMKKQAEGTFAYVDKLTKKIAGSKAELSEIDNDEIGMIPGYEVDAKRLQAEIEELQGQLEKVNGRLAAARSLSEKKTMLSKDIEGDEATLKALPSVADVPDIEAIKGRLEVHNLALKNNNEQVALHAAYVEAKKIRGQYEEHKEASDELTELLDKLKKDLPETITKDANMPIEGLRFEGDNIFIGSRNLDTMSTSEQVKVAVSIIEQFNKEKPLKLLCVDRAESLDEETLKLFVDSIPDGYQFWITQVQHGEIPAGAFQVESGTIKKKEVA